MEVVSWLNMQELWELNAVEEDGSQLVTNKVNIRTNVSERFCEYAFSANGEVLYSWKSFVRLSRKAIKTKKTPKSIIIKKFTKTSKSNSHNKALHRLKKITQLMIKFNGFWTEAIENKFKRITNCKKKTSENKNTHNYR